MMQVYDSEIWFVSFFYLSYCWNVSMYLQGMEDFFLWFRLNMNWSLEIFYSLKDILYLRKIPQCFIMFENRKACVAISFIFYDDLFILLKHLMKNLNLNFCNFIEDFFINYNISIKLDFLYLIIVLSSSLWINSSKK